ncbi:Uncharacterised protein [Salmonella enterica subsp. enterica serovar Bovismorbificans]|uniref:Uncharacterized protein n=1 Tax=Salmonella enterica subsp. enterica serovar Bovismorbificans TaxID=58097 RepID=A0A655DEI0_SALET|nr:Uncharacterised protein [Salmonella enterica subsp. enterica serovar Bovismorbificans]CPR49655.1 Uncharacterised protein [Salmonella enterica subsp. enterica serovar Bovismorbificans]
MVGDKRDSTLIRLRSISDFNGQFRITKRRGVNHQTRAGITDNRQTGYLDLRGGIAGLQRNGKRGLDWRDLHLIIRQYRYGKPIRSCAKIAYCQNLAPLTDKAPGFAGRKQQLNHRFERHSLRHGRKMNANFSLTGRIMGQRRVQIADGNWRLRGGQIAL